MARMRVLGEPSERVRSEIQRVAEEEPRAERLEPFERPRYAARADVEEFAAGLGVNHLQCRELGHNWRPWVARYDQEHNSFERALRCVRCRTERWETIGRSGVKLSAHYVYPKGYTCPLGRIIGEGRDALRLESLIRELTDEQQKGLRNG